jgi:hypothetical protein
MIQIWTRLTRPSLFLRAFPPGHVLGGTSILALEQTAHTYFIVAILPDDVKENTGSSSLMDAADNGYHLPIIDHEVFYRCFLFVPRDCFGFRSRRSS